MYHQAEAPLVVRARDRHVSDFPWVTPSGILSWVRKGTRSPVMDVALGTFHDL